MNRMRKGACGRLARTPLYSSVAEALVIAIAVQGPIAATAAAPVIRIAPVLELAPPPLHLAALTSTPSSPVTKSSPVVARAEGRAAGMILELGGSEAFTSSDTRTQSATEPKSFDATAASAAAPLAPLAEIITGESRTLGCANPSGCPEGTPPDGMPLGDVPDPLENEVFALSRSGSALVSFLPGALGPGTSAFGAAVSSSFAGVRCNDETRALELVAPSGEAAASEVDALVVGGQVVPIAGKVEPNTTLVIPGVPLVVLNEQRCGVDEATRTASCTTNALSAGFPGAVRLVLSSAAAEIQAPADCELCVPILTNSSKSAEVVDTGRLRFRVHVENSGCGVAQNVMVIDRIPLGLSVDVASVRVDGAAATPDAVSVSECPQDDAFESCPNDGGVDTARSCLTIRTGDLARGARELTFEATREPGCASICNEAVIQGGGATGPVSVSRATMVQGSGRSEVCNGIDDDCNGVVDDHLGTKSCGIGACRRTVDDCVGGVEQSCTPGTPSAEVCGNGIDDDCDGEIDDADACAAHCTAGISCPTGFPGICADGHTTCPEGPQGATVCQADQASQPESCGDGIDQDCDGSDLECQSDQPPVITSTPVISAAIGVAYTYDVDATDADAGDTLTYSLDIAPAGMTIDGATGVIQWTAAAGQEGANQVTARVTDSQGLFDTQSFTVTVADATCSSVGAKLSGLRWELPCVGSKSSDTCGADTEHSQSTTLGGDPGATYDVTLRFRGVVEEKTYNGGNKDGYWHIGGTPDGGTFNIYELTISDPPQTYYLNSGQSGMRHCVPLDYIRTVQAKTGATVTLRARSIDNRQIFNRDASGNPIVVPAVPPAPNPYDGQFVQMDVVGLGCPSPNETPGPTGTPSTTEPPSGSQPTSTPTPTETQIAGTTPTASPTPSSTPAGTPTPAYCLEPPADLVMWIPADGNGDDIKGSADGNSGAGAAQLQNGATFAAGEVNQAFSLNGADQYVLVGGIL